MPGRQIKILSIVPYKILPPVSGGHLCICYTHHYLGQLHPDHIVGTANNGAAEEYAFKLHKMFPASSKRYLPFYRLGAIADLARQQDITHIICEHPYMAFTAIALSRKLKIPWYMRSHNIESERFRSLGKSWWPLLRMYERYAMRKSAGVFFITPEDRDWAIGRYQLPPSKGHILPFGTTMKEAPEGHAEAKQAIALERGIDAAKPWLYFLGALDYYPNEQAVEIILNEVVPRLNADGAEYEIFIGGRGLSQTLQRQIAATANVTYTGFIPVLDTFLKACDVMLNPVLLGGGIKTKAIEALGYNKIVVSTHSGAAGISAEVCGDNLLITADDDWEGFAALVLRAMLSTPSMPQAFYDGYYWGNIVQRMAKVLEAG